MINQKQTLFVKNRLIGLFDEYSDEAAFLVDFESVLFEYHQHILDFQFYFELAVYKVSQHSVE